jgi:hypothetical protein
MFAIKLTGLPEEENSLRSELLQDHKIKFLSQRQKKELLHSVLLRLFLACCLAVIIGGIWVVLVPSLLLPTRGSSLFDLCL